MSSTLCSHPRFGWDGADTAGQSAAIRWVFSPFTAGSMFDPASSSLQPELSSQTDAQAGPGPLSQLVHRAKQLYSLPAVAVEVLQLTNHPQVDCDRLKRCIERDPALTAKVLRVVNSSLFGFHRDVSDLNQALALLGIKPLKLLVLGFSIPKPLLEDVEAEALATYWQLSLVKAVTAREIAEHKWPAIADEAFISGLLCDIGMLVLLQELGKPYADFLETVRSERGDLGTLEMSTLGFDHVILSARLLEHWRLPEPVVRAVALQPQTIASADTRPPLLARSLMLASLLVDVLLSGRPNQLAALYHLSEQLGGPNEEELTDIADVLSEKVSQLADVLDLQLPEEQNYTDVLDQAHRRLSDVAESAACDPAISREQILELWKTNHLGDATILHGGPTEPPAALPVGDRDAPAATPAPITVATGGEDDPGMLGRLASAVSLSRQRRRPLSLLLMEVDDFAGLMVLWGRTCSRALSGKLADVIHGIADGEATLVQTGDGQFAVILPNADRSECVSLGRRLIDERVNWLPAGPHSSQATINIGVATVAMPACNFPATDLYAAASRCLEGARSFGGSSVKSIDIY